MTEGYPWNWIAYWSKIKLNCKKISRRFTIFRRYLFNYSTAKKLTAMDSLSFKNGWIRGIERQFLIARSSNYDQYLDCKIVEKKIDVNVKKRSANYVEFSLFGKYRNGKNWIERQCSIAGWKFTPSPYDLDLDSKWLKRKWSRFTFHSMFIHS